jgi:hypothetical protein
MPWSPKCLLAATHPSLAATHSPKRSQAPFQPAPRLADLVLMLNADNHLLVSLRS